MLGETAVKCVQSRDQAENSSIEAFYLKLLSSYIFGKYSMN